jgi:hypothetical protein
MRVTQKAQDVTYVCSLVCLGFHAVAQRRCSKSLVLLGSAQVGVPAQQSQRQHNTMHKACIQLVVPSDLSVLCVPFGCMRQHALNKILR